MRIHRYLVLVAMISSAMYAGRANAGSHDPGIIQSDKGGAVGYQHSLERSRFTTGATGGDLRRVKEGGFLKLVGPYGVFATDLHNGFVVAVQSGGSDKSEARAGNVVEKPGYIMDPDKHNKHVADYFLAAGVPKKQIGSIHANTYLSSSGSAQEVRPAPPTVDGYATVIGRVIEEYPVVDSVAWARMNERGEAVSEWVYWPAIPAKALAEARRLHEILSGPGKTRFVARLPAGLPEGKIVIRHSSATAQGSFEAFASYDVVDRRTFPESAASPSSRVSVIVRHFDVDGVERRLPQERRNLGADFPAKEKQREHSPVRP